MACSYKARQALRAIFWEQTRAARFCSSSNEQFGSSQPLDARFNPRDFDGGVHQNRKSLTLFHPQTGIRAAKSRAIVQVAHYRIAATGLSFAQIAQCQAKHFCFGFGERIHYKNPR
jgi:hypothetical protein